MRLGLIARSDRTGLGNQTRNLARMLNPDKVMLIDSSFFNGNAQHPEEWAHYKKRLSLVEGFPNEQQVMDWLKDLDVVISCEIFYNSRFVDIANAMGVKTVNHYNWEFADYLRTPTLTLPTKMVSPSTWHLEDSKRLWGDERVMHLPTPVFTEDYTQVREHNMSRREVKKRFLHIMGRAAVNDRNGTADLLRALQYCRTDFELVIKAQAGDFSWVGNYPNLTIDTSSPENEVDLYKDFDAMILPRRYAGQCLPMTEALCAGLPVIMTDISPNNDVLPKHWLVGGNWNGSFMARTNIEMFTANPVALAQRIDLFASKDLTMEKKIAYNIGYEQFSADKLKPQWEKLLEDISSR